MKLGTQLLPRFLSWLLSNDKPMVKPVPDEVLAYSPPPPMPTPTPTPAPNFGEMTPYEKLTAETFDNYGVPRPVAFGMAQAEGGRRNKFNIGAFDSNPSNALIQDDLANATTAAKMLSGKANTEFYGGGEPSRKKFEIATKLGTPSAILAGYEDAGFAGDKNTWKARSASQGGAGKIYDSWKDFVMDTSGYKKWIK